MSAFEEKMVSDFLATTKMFDADGITAGPGVRSMAEFLARPENIYKCILASDMTLPVLSFLACDIEKEFDENSKFPVVAVGDNSNATNKQNVGRMIKTILRAYGYEPIKGELCRLPAISGAEYFSMSAVYKKTGTPQFAIKIMSEAV